MTLFKVCLPNICSLKSLVSLLAIDNYQQYGAESELSMLQSRVVLSYEVPNHLSSHSGFNGYVSLRDFELKFTKYKNILFITIVLQRIPMGLSLSHRSAFHYVT